MGIKAIRFEAELDKQMGWYWVFYAGNGEEIARSSESYNDLSDCQHSIDLIKSTDSLTTVKVMGG